MSSLNTYVNIVTNTPQVEQADPRQVENNAGGFTFELSPQSRLLRWLVLGSEGGTYYVAERKHTIENVDAAKAALDADPAGTVELIATVSESGRAPKNDQAILAIALACAHPTAKPYALQAIPRVCRTGTHLLQFVATVKRFRGWGRSLSAAVAAWYTSKPESKLCHQVTKYRQRGGMSHRDVLRLCHAKSEAHAGVFRWIAAGSAGAGQREFGGRSYGAVAIPDVLLAFDELQATDSVERVCELIAAHDFTHEMVPSKFIRDQRVWEALLPKIQYQALVRNLGRLGSIGLLTPLSETARLVATKLCDGDALRRSRIHPVGVLTARLTYARGRGIKGNMTWSAVAPVVDALESAFYASFAHIEPAGKRTLLALDVSGSMSGAVLGDGVLTARDASAVMAMVTARTEPAYAFMGFSHRPIELPITASMTLDEVLRTISGIPFGATDCGLPMVYASQRGLDVDTFCVYTDNETYIGPVHPHVAMRTYRRRVPDAKLAVIGMTSTGFTIADPTDTGMLDVVGFDAAAPAMLADFSAGRLTA